MSQVLNRHIILRLIFSGLLVLLTGCTVDTAEPALPPDKHIVILWHSFSGAESRALQMLTDQFNADNTQNIILITEYQQDILTKIEATAAEHRPDLVVLWPKDLQAYLDAGLLGATPALAPTIRRERADLLPMAAALYTVNGTMQALPLGLLTYLMYYNVDWIADLDYTPATATWDDWQRTACAATNPLGGQTGIGLPAQASSLLVLLTSGKAEIVRADGYYNFSDSAGQKAANVLNTVLGNACGLVYSDRDVGVTRLGHSSLAMLIESSMRLKEIEQAVINGRNFKLGLTTLPGPDGPGPTLWHGPGLAIVAPEGARRDAALSVVEWFFSTEAQSTWSTATRYLPVRRSLIETRLNSENLPEVEAALLHITLAAVDSGAWVAWPRYTDSMACRAALLRGLLALKESTTTPGAYIDIAVTACNTAVKP